MKCPKCNYISFDYNQTCPKCKKALSEVKEKLNYASFKPSPPAISNFKSHTPTESITMQQKTAADMDETAELAFSDSEDFDIQFDSSGPEQKAEESGTEISFEEASDELALDFDDLDMGSDDGGTSVSEDALESSLDLSFEEESDELSLDFDEPENDKAVSKTSQKAQETSLEDSLAADLDRAFDEDPDGALEKNEETLLMEPSEEEEVSAAFDFDDTSMEKTEMDMELDLSAEEGPEISIDLDDSFAMPEENAADTDTEITFMDEGAPQSDPSELEVLDLDLDLEKSNN